MSRPLIKTPAQLLTFVDSLMLPLTDMNILLPVSGLVEVIESSVETNGSDAENWFCGVVDWQGEKIPVVFYELFISQIKVARTKVMRCAILRRPADGNTSRYYALVIQGYPRSLRITPTSDFRRQSDGVAQNGVMMHATFDDEPVVIPDLDVLEEALVLANE